ncbi:MAG: hypothetical protein B193_1189 [Solidesulfovibrio magneticus str. Maddingley MBC34]|uniref:Excalibur calcium-binding domain-containing protein n=1 Tax=Solidesulfovibrio magneticus str. Maddingley MBC34 TaxID=1206767 RepID=K6GT59_9BACT|nr:MAG: hypothetical protein B193_1189 [Solidesulfovibrio magneticus str. Maddingley MBC34]
MLVLPRKRRLAIALFALALLALAVCAVPSLSQPAAGGYARLLRRHVAPPPTAVADCAVAALALHAGSPDAPIPDSAFEALSGRCRQAARQAKPGPRDGDDCELGAVGAGHSGDKEKYYLSWRSPSGV